MDAWLDRLRDEIEETTMGLRESDWLLAPAGRWNSAETIEHLGRTYGTTAKMLELALGVGGPPRVRSANISELWKRVMVVTLGFFPEGLSAPAMVQPKGDSGPVALERAFNNLIRMDAAIAAAEDRWGISQPIAMHMVLGPMNVAQWRRFHYVHGHHHMVQIRKKLGKRATR